MASECVKVMVRCRPMNSKEIAKSKFIFSSNPNKTNLTLPPPPFLYLCVDCESVIEVDKPTNQIIIRPHGKEGDEKIFAYDSVYGVDSTQREIYDETAFPLVESVLGGYNGTIFAYGQTGCGKTHTMAGKHADPNHKGIIPNAFDHIYGCIDDDKNSTKKFLVRCSYVEIYQEEIRDLLGSDPNLKLDLKEDPNKGVYVKDLTILTVKSIKEIDTLMEKGNSLRKVGQTAMNDTSSRSHSLFTVFIETAETVSYPSFVFLSFFECFTKKAVTYFD